MAVTLDLGGSANEIVKEITRTKVSLEGLQDSYDELGETTKKTLGGAAKDQDKFTNATKGLNFELDKEIKQVNALKERLKSLEKNQKKTNDPKLIKRYNTEIVKTRGALRSLKGAGAAGFGTVNAGATASIGLFKILKTEIATAFLPLAVLGAVAVGFKAIIDSVEEFEQTAADLEAITGATGSTLQFLKDEAVAVGVETTISANDTLEAYKLIASAKPELLQNAAALASITREAVTLTEAFGGDLPTVATNLTDIMNKFSAPADQAGRFVNALAAGSKEGSADVGSLAASFLGAGTEMAAANVHFEEGVGLFETLAEKGVKNSEAGTALRNVLSKLSATDILPKEALARLKAAGVDIDGLSDKSLTFSDRLRKLAPIQDDANALTALFGLENKATAQILLNNIDRVDELTEAVTGTNVANDQAAIRTATLGAEFTKLKNTITAVVQSNGDGLGRFLALLVRLVRFGVLFLKDALDAIAPAFGQVTGAVSGLFSLLASFLPAQREAGEGATLWQQAIALLTQPLRLIFIIIGKGIGLVTAIISKFKSFASQNAFLSASFAAIRIAVGSIVQGFIDLPASIVGSLNTIRVFVLEAGRAIAQLGRNIGNTLAEAFDIQNLVLNGRQDLDNAVAKLLTNPFKGVGSKAAQAFTDGFDATKKLLEIPVAAVPVATGGAAPTDDKTPTSPTAPTSFIDPEAVKKAADKAAKEAERAAKEKARLEIAALADGIEKQLALEDLRYSDLKAKLEQYGIETDEATQQHEFNRFEIRSKFIEATANLEKLSGEEKLAFIFEQTKREINALESSLRAANGGELLEGQAQQLAILRKQANTEYLTDLKAFQTKDQQEQEAHQIALLELKRGDFKSQAEFEIFKQREILNIRLKFAEAQIKAIEAVSGAEDGAALKLRKTINEIKGEIAGLDSAAGDGEFSFFKLLGLDPNDPEGKKIIEGLTTLASTTMDILNQVNDAKLKSIKQDLKNSKEEIKSIDDKIEAKEAELEGELERADAGFAARVEERRNEIAALKAQRALEVQEQQKALEEKKRLEKQKLLLDSISQASSLITSATNIFQSLSGIPFVGVPLAIGLIATMIGSFVATKAKAFSAINKQKARKGMSGVVTGRGHDTGGEAFGDHIEVESGEGFGVLSREATRAWGKDYLGLTDAMNRGDRNEVARLAALFGDPSTSLKKRLPNKLGSKSLELDALLRQGASGADLSETNRLLEEGNKQRAKGKKEVSYTKTHKIIKVGNYTRRIKLKNG